MLLFFYWLTLVGPSPCRPLDVASSRTHLWAVGGGSRAGMWTVCVDADYALEVRQASGPRVTRLLTTQEQVEFALAVDRLPKANPSYVFGTLVTEGDDYSILLRTMFGQHEYTLATTEDSATCTDDMQAILRTLVYLRGLVPSKEGLDPRTVYSACWGLASAH